MITFIPLFHVPSLLNIKFWWFPLKTHMILIKSFLFFSFINFILKMSIVKVANTTTQPVSYLLTTTLLNGSIVLKNTDIPLSSGKIPYLIFFKPPKEFGISTCSPFPPLTTPLCCSGCEPTPKLNSCPTRPLHPVIFFEH